jgi:hypothetical protein
VGLGLENTFMAIPYDPLNIPAYRRTTYETPANSRPDLPTAPDPTRQTTAEEMGALLAMIYHCAYNGGGTLMVVYPGDYTAEECQYIVDLMVLNEEGNLIRFGVPDDVRVSHKHGWILDTHGDAGIVLTPGGDYVIVEYLHYPGSWLQSDYSFPILREISRAVYNYFNFSNPYLGDRLAEGGFLDEEGVEETETGEEAPAEGEEAEEVPGLHWRAAPLPRTRRRELACRSHRRRRRRRKPAMLPARPMPRKPPRYPDLSHPAGRQLSLSPHKSHRRKIWNTRLGRTGLKVSTICLGTMQFGWSTGEFEQLEDTFRGPEVSLSAAEKEALDAVTSWQER